VQNEIKTPVLRELDRALQLKLGGIFAPLASQKRDEWFDQTVPSSARFAHYTSAEAAIKIIEQKRVWLRNTTCMVDYREVQHGYNILRKAFGDADNLKSFIGEVEKIAPGVATQAISNFDGWWQSGALLFNTFITSVSEHDLQEDSHGRLSMWRAFGANSTRVAIVLKIPKTSDSGDALKLVFSPVLYLKDEDSSQIIPQVIQNVKSNSEFLKSVPYTLIQNWIFSMLVLGATCVKHEGFREEREWRVVDCPQFWPSPFVESSTETVRGVPQIVRKIPLDSAKYPELSDYEFGKIFERLIIGPSLYPVAMRDAFLDALTKAGVPDARNKIFISGIPIRS